MLPGTRHVNTKSIRLQFTHSWCLSEALTEGTEFPQDKLLQSAETIPCNAADKSLFDEDTLFAQTWPNVINRSCCHRVTPKTLSAVIQHLPVGLMERHGIGLESGTMNDF